MSLPLRTSPVHEELSKLEPLWRTRDGMRIAVRLPRDAEPMDPRLADLSFLPRLGVKGPAAEHWLRSQRVPVPDQANSWALSQEGVLVARLARTEFLLEDQSEAAGVRGLRARLTVGSGLYPVPRQDAALVLEGERATMALGEVCSFPFGTLSPGALALTVLASVSVAVLYFQQGAARRYRIFCDGTFGPYLFSTLREVAESLGGGVVGVGRIFPEFNSDSDQKASSS